MPPSVPTVHAVAPQTRAEAPESVAEGGGWATLAGAQDADTCALWLDVADWSPWRRRATALLDAAERARVERMRRPADREMLTIAYAAHRLLLASCLGRAPEAVPLTRDARGCPRVPGTAWHTSLSHADGAVAIAASRMGPVGIDLEARARAGLVPELAERICSPAELRHYAAMGPEALLALWVRKEAVLKACGWGLGVEMSGIEVPDGASCVLPRDGRRVHVAMLPVGAAHVGALASPGPDGIRHVPWWRP